VCGRHYAAEVLRDGFAETVRLDQLDEPAAQKTPSHPADRYIGRKFGHYEVVSKLGQGGMGSVYRALDPSLQRYVALKVIHPGPRSAHDTEQIQRLCQEAIAQARVNHPNVVHIYYVGREGNAPFFAMELVDGITLADKLQKGPLPFAEVIDIALQVVDALKHSVSFDILHGDIKPANILLTEAGTVKLSDFGLARRLSQAIPTADGIAGTPQYMAPETIDGADADARSDMYSLGVTLFEMTFGRLPFSCESNSLHELLQAHREAPIEFPEPWPADLPDRFRDILAKLLAKSPDDRYASYDELSAVLQIVQPTRLSKAGRVQRGLAWFVDLALANTVLQILSTPLVQIDWRPLLTGRPLASLILMVLVLMAGAAGPLLAAAVQTYWAITPGKKLFQIRIVDRHGLRPRQPTLAARMAFQMLPLAPAALLPVQAVLGMDSLVVIAALLQLFVIADVAAAVLRRDGRSLHDLIFDTRVVLDVDPRRDAARSASTSMHNER